jgi:RNA polymerase sigma-70 factor (ECF subfamily)
MVRARPDVSGDKVAAREVPPVGGAEDQAPRLPGGFGHFYLHEYRGVVELAYALSGNRAGAEDIAQEAFLRAYRDWQRVGRYQHPGAWVRRVAVNLATSALRRRLIEARALARVWARREPSLVELPASEADFWGTVRSLPRRQAQVVTLHYLEDLSVAEIARVLGCAEGTVKAQLHNGRETLARRLPLIEETEP